MFSLIIAIKTASANLKEMVARVAAQTGDENPFFCPSVEEGKPYDGHAHTFPPDGANEASSTPIELK